MWGGGPRAALLVYRQARPGPSGGSTNCSGPVLPHTAAAVSETAAAAAAGGHPDRARGVVAAPGRPAQVPAAALARAAAARGRRRADPPGRPYCRPPWARGGAMATIWPA